MLSVAPQTAETRPLPLQRRPDLVCREQQFGGTTYWHVKDPIALRYFQLKPEEYAVLQMLDGTVSLREIRRRFELKFAPQRLGPMQIQSFLGMLHSSGLVVSDTPGQAEHLIARTNKHNWRKFLSTATGVLAIRLPGFDPHRFLNWLTPQLRFVFSPVCVALCCVLMLSALLLAGLQSDVLAARLPRFHELFSASNLFWLAVTLGVTKVLHELGHAVACRHFGAECHEMGLMLLVFTPCLYCNVSDAWMLPRRWQRIAISAAGVYAELVLASACLFLWWYSVPGPFNAACLNVVLVCSVSTVLFNGNPLLRYDGYYILSDLVEIPNLRQQATALIRNAMSRWFLGTEVGNQRLLPDRRQRFLIGWSLAASAYRIVIVWSILWFVHAVLKPYGLQPLAVVVGIITVAGMIVAPLVQFVSLLRNPFWSRTVDWPRFRIRSLIALAILTGLITAPLPSSVTAPAIIQTEGARSVYVSVPGRLIEALPAGTTVEPDAVVGRLENLDIERTIAVLSGDVTRLAQTDS
ncbi:MAG: site-2 protease family protein [Planctomycetota bacterium]|jgi:putative peptide zinc metalloprotease protein